jgi:hypothetical protein
MFNISIYDIATGERVHIIDGDAECVPTKGDIWIPEMTNKDDAWEILGDVIVGKPANIGKRGIRYTHHVDDVMILAKKLDGIPNWVPGNRS